jgi:hypothetical protein
MLLNAYTKSLQSQAPLDVPDLLKLIVKSITVLMMNNLFFLESHNNMPL